MLIFIYYGKNFLIHNGIYLHFLRTIMIIKKSNIAILLIYLLSTLPIFSAEQDNWYIANEWTVTGGTGVAYYEDNNTGVGQIYVCNGSSTSSKISVYDLNGSLARDIPIANNRYYAYDLVLDSNGTIFIAERHAVTCLDNNLSLIHI